MIEGPCGAIILPLKLAAWLLANKHSRPYGDPTGSGGYTGVGTPQKTIQSPGILDKALETLYKSSEYYIKTQNIEQNLTILIKNTKH